MSDFRELPVQKGVGDWHFNRFRILFEPPKGITQQFLAADFCQKFPNHFNSRLAQVEFTSRTFAGKRTLRFHGVDRALGIDLASPHHDWVYIADINPTLGFTAQTLQRNFTDLHDDVAAGVGGFAINPAAATAAVELNRKHFLAGRRSWRLDHSEVFGYKPGFLVLETIAVERFSDPMFLAMNLKFNHLEKMIPPIWATLLTQSVRDWSATIVHHPLPRPGWTRSGTFDVYQYVNNNLKSQNDLQGSAEFHDAFALFPTIIPRGNS